MRMLQMLAPFSRPAAAPRQPVPALDAWSPFWPPWRWSPAVRRSGPSRRSERAELERFRDSVGGHGGLDGPAGARAAPDRAGQGRRAATPMAHLKLGFLSLRLGELGGQSHYEDAASEFQWAIDLQPTWPYGYYGMGFAEYGVGDSQISFVTGIKTMLGKDALTRSAMAFAKSAEVDPSFDQGLVDLANTALRQRVNIKLGVALRRAPAGRHHRRRPRIPRCCSRAVGWSARWATATPPWPPSRAIWTRGPIESLGLLEVARTMFLLGRFDGVAPYFEGAASDDSVTVAGYRGDLVTIASRQRDGRVRPHHGRAAGRLPQAVLERARPHRAARRGRAAPRALPPALLRPQEFPAHLAQPPLRHRRALPLRQPRLRRPGRDLHPPRRAEQPRELRRAGAGAQRVVALQPSRRRHDLPLHGAGGRAGLQAGREPLRRARLQQRARAPRRGAGRQRSAIRWRSSSSSRASSSRRSTAGSRRRAGSAPAATRPRSGRWGRRASPSAPRATATSCASPTS